MIYAIAMFGIGYWANKNYTKDLDEFALAGRRLHPVVAALSVSATSESGFWVLGAVGWAYAVGFQAFWVVPGCVFGHFIHWVIVGGRMRRFSGLAKNITLADFFVSRLGDKRHILRVICVIPIILFAIGYVVAQLTAMGKVFSAIGITDFGYGVLLGSLVILIYVLAGGFTAVSWTDLVQGLLFFAVCVFFPIWGIFYLGGWGSFIQQLETISPTMLSLTAGQPWVPAIGFAIGMWGISLGYFGGPQVVARHMAIRSAEQTRFAAFCAVTWACLTFMGAVLMGLVVRLLISPELIADPEQGFIVMTKYFFPAGLDGLILAGLIAAIMSTADSHLMVATTSISQDILHRLLGKEYSAKKMVTTTRIAVVVIMAIAVLLTLGEPGYVFWLALFAWAGLGASFGPPVILTLYWKKTTWQGAIAGIIAGMVSVLLWYYIPALSAIIYELVPGFFISLAVTYLVSLATQPKDSARA